ncbi:uncharacterized protein LOC120301433 [Crotalus tigris]|uniref:uncharacterized protein LOC120301433 n=1 Tax=Crotalus tigris TaxID=88082 RepID=UPI00192F71BA|nr:uncharacterized protein LOC120301433 [Crotalus tigris]
MLGVADQKDAAGETIGDHDFQPALALGQISGPGFHPPSHSIIYGEDLCVWGGESRSSLSLLQPSELNSASPFLLAARSETTSRGAEAQPVTALRVTNPSKTAGNQQHLHRELLFTHRKGLSLRSKPELLQVLEHRNRCRDGSESGLKPSPLEQELLRWQQRREQHQQQEATGDPGGSQPEFVKVREKLRRTQQQRDPSPQHASPSLISVPFPRLPHPNRKPSQVPVKHPPVALQAAASHPQSSLKASTLTSVPSKHSLANNT